MPGWPIRKVVSGGIRVTEAAAGKGVPYVESPNGVAVTFTASGGIPLSQGGGVLPSLYTGQVATKCRHMDTANASYKQIMSRSPHFTREARTTMGIEIPNWYWGASGDTGSGGTAVFTASIEYPAGVFTQLTFGGSTSSGTITDGGWAISDEITVNIPTNALFWVRIFGEFSVAVIYTNIRTGHNNRDSINGSLFNMAASGLVDQTMGGTISQFSGISFCPFAIFGQTRKPSVALVGDSRVWGSSDTYDASGDVGELARSIGATLPYINLGSFGDQMNSSTTGMLVGTRYAKRKRAAIYCSHVLCELGINDINVSGRSAAQVRSDRNLVSTLHFPGKPFFETTITPGGGSSTDAWATTANQTIAANNAARATFNANLLALSGSFSPDFKGAFNTADVVETSTGSGVLKAPGYTSDGLHLLQLGHVAIRDAAVINPALFTRAGM